MNRCTLCVCCFGDRQRKGRSQPARTGAGRQDDDLVLVLARRAGRRRSGAGSPQHDGPPRQRGDDEHAGDRSDSYSSSFGTPRHARMKMRSWPTNVSCAHRLCRNRQSAGASSFGWPSALKTRLAVTAATMLGGTLEQYLLTMKTTRVGRASASPAPAGGRAATTAARRPPARNQADDDAASRFRTDFHGCSRRNPRRAPKEGGERARSPPRR